MNKIYIVLKNLKRNIAIAAFLVITTLFVSTQLMAQSPPPPNDGDSGAGGTPVGGTAPIGGGLALLLAFGSAYGGTKVFKVNKDNL